MFGSWHWWGTSMALRCRVASVQHKHHPRKHTAGPVGPQLGVKGPNT